MLSRILAVVLTVALLGTGVIVLVLSSSAAVSSDPFEVPVLQAGDRAHYLNETGYALLVEILPPETFRNETHVLEVNPVDVRHETPNGWQNVTILVDPSTGRNVAVRFSEVQSSSFDAPLGLPAGLPGEIGGSSSWEFEMTHLDNLLILAYAGPCGIHNPFQANPRDPTVPYSMYCREAVRIQSDEVDFYPAESRWRAVIETTDEAGRTILFEIETPFVYEGSKGTFTDYVTLREDVPFPVLLSYKGDDWTLNAFESGTGRTAQSNVVQSPLPGVRSSSLTPWILDERGIDHAFPLSEAYQAALDDPEEDFRSYLDSNPDAYLNYAEYSLGQTTTYLVHHWHFVAASEHQFFEANVRMYEFHAGDLGIGDLGIKGPVEVDAETSQQEGRVPPKHALPPTLPPVVDLFERYRAFFDDEPQSYGFEIACSYSDCDEVRVQLKSANRKATWEPASPDGLNVYESEARHVVMDEEARPLRTGVSTMDLRGFDMPTGSVAPAALTQDDADSLSLITPFGGWTAIGLSAAIVIAFASKWLAAAFFTRLHKDNLLEHPVRKEIHEAVLAEPGVHYQQLVRNLDRPQGTLRHHLRILEQAGLLRAVKGTRHTCYFIPGTMDRQTMDVAPLMRSEGTRRVLQAVEEHPGSTTSGLARHLGMSPSTVHTHLIRLKEANMVEAGQGFKGKSWRLMRHRVNLVAP